MRPGALLDKRPGRAHFPAERVPQHPENSMAINLRFAATLLIRFPWARAGVRETSLAGAPFMIEGGVIRHAR